MHLTVNVVDVVSVLILSVGGVSLGYSQGYRNALRFRWGGK